MKKKIAKLPFTRFKSHTILDNTHRTDITDKAESMAITV